MCSAVVSQDSSDRGVGPKQGTNLSQFCNYEQTFTTYDTARVPVGASEILSIFERNGSSMPSIASLETQHILEGGFGTGAYLEFFAGRVGHLYGVEASQLGVITAQQKLSETSNSSLRQGDILNLSEQFNDRQFHGYMVNQVLHHIDTDHKTFPNIDRFLAEASRVLKVGGVLTINTCTQEQLHPDSGCYWNYTFIREAALELRTRYIPIEQLIEKLQKAGFADVAQTVPQGNIFTDRYYSDPTIALEPQFQHGDSVYSLVTDINSANVLLRDAIESQEAEKVMKRAAQFKALSGEAIIISAVKV